VNYGMFSQMDSAALFHFVIFVSAYIIVMQQLQMYDISLRVIDR